MLQTNFLTTSIWLLTYSRNRLLNWKERSEYTSSLLQKGHYFECLLFDLLLLKALLYVPIHASFAESTELWRWLNWHCLFIKCKDVSLIPKTHVWEPRHVTMLVHTPVIPVPGRQGQVDFHIWLGSLANHRVSGNSGEKNKILSRGKKMKSN